MFERLYDTIESTQVNFIGYISERARYDFAIVHTDNFFGKPLVVCMQTGRSSLLSAEDVVDLEHLQRSFAISSKEEAQELSVFMQQRLPDLGLKEQY
ncbi:DUF3055 domain-containing protein [Paenibacillus turpanensis]|uniref:DUF3055 domain-containing protein n=1 Tax=Paenibacillus turpanensis TaxID=2689078 RepID=UPI001409879D|nr:DUF3055 domain-containing protein [Paenibacillus turpanensis]